MNIFKRTSEFIWQRLRSPSMPTGMVLAALVGAGTGVGAVVFRWLIMSLQHLFFVEGSHWLSFMGPYYVILLPALGGLFVGPLIYFFAREAKGHGVPEVMLAVAKKGGRIRPRVAFIKTLASAITIGSGGSVGREGPIVQIGSTLGSALGQLLRLPTAWIRTLLGCGCAAGIAATFNAPLGGTFFTMELIFRSFNSRGFAFIVVSAVAGTLTAQAFLGASPAFQLGNLYQLVDSREMLLYGLLGVLAGLAGVVFMKAIHFSEDLFARFRSIPEWFRPVIGGLVVGVIALYSLDLCGVGYGETAWTPQTSMDQMLEGALSLKVLVLVALLKIVATSTTVGSGGSGGVFAPSLFLGAATGGALGMAASHLFPGEQINPGAYALVGAAALFAGVTRAPITSVMMMFELTRNYALILPVMTSVVIATGVVMIFSRETIYTEKLMRRGIDLLKMSRANLVSGVQVENVMTKEFPAVDHSMSLRELEIKLAMTGHHGFPVLDDEGKLYGMVGAWDVKLAREGGIPESTPVADICSIQLVTAYPDETLAEVLGRFSEANVGRIPVVDPADENKLLGVLRRSSLFEAWRVAVEDTSRSESMS